MILQAPFRNRINFGTFLTSLVPYGGLGVEIGTDQGDFAFHLLSSWQPRDFFCVDPWTAGYDDDDPVSRRTPSEMAEAERRARETLSKFPCCWLYKWTSREAVDSFSRDILDFAYVDGNHRADAVAFDLRAWHQRLKSGGILAGHDFVVPGNDAVTRNVQGEVLRFATYQALDVHIVLEDDPNNPWSWYMVK